VAGRQRRRLVQEEQLGVPARRHHGAAPAFEVEQADDPAIDRGITNDVPVRVMQQTAVAHQRAPRVDRDELAGRRDAILERHGDRNAATVGLRRFTAA
jgi:hypothetical protein